MELNFKKLEAAALPEIMPHFKYRKNRTCDSVFPGIFLWKDYYHVRYALDEDFNLYWRLTVDGVEYAALPTCAEEDLPFCFQHLKEYFNLVLKKKLLIFLADEEAVTLLSLSAEE